MCRSIFWLQMNFSQNFPFPLNSIFLLSIVAFFFFAPHSNCNCQFGACASKNARCKNHIRQNVNKTACRMACSHTCASNIHWQFRLLLTVLKRKYEHNKCKIHTNRQLTVYCLAILAWRHLIRASLPRTFSENFTVSFSRCLFFSQFLFGQSKNKENVVLYSRLSKFTWNEYPQGHDLSFVSASNKRFET